MGLEKVLQENFSKKNKIIPSKFHYDLQGSKYFEKITKTKEYYVTRIEKEILKKMANKINFHVFLTGLKIKKILQNIFLFFQT